jgi:lipase chaperone LimK
MRGRQLPMTWVAGAVAAAALVVIGLQGLPAPASRLVVAAPVAEERTAAPSSLAGTVPDGGATAAADQSLVLEPALIRLFDYYLTTVGERPMEAIRTQVDRDLDGRLNPLAGRQAKDLFDRYVRFKTALQAQRPARPAGNSVDTLREALRRMLALRATFFTDAESRALFAAQDAEADAALARMAAEQDPSLTDAQRRERLAALDARQPAGVRADREASLLVTRLDEAAQKIRAEGGSEDDVYRMRAAATSPEAANRLADLDRDEAAWKARIADYQAQRGAVLATPGSDADHDAAMADLRNRLFTAQEQRRLAAYGG